MPVTTRSHDRELLSPSNIIQSPSHIMSEPEPVNPPVGATSSTAGNSSSTVTSPLSQDALLLEIRRLQDRLAILESNRAEELIEAEEDNVIGVEAVQGDVPGPERLSPSPMTRQSRHIVRDTDEYEYEMELASGDDGAKIW